MGKENKALISQVGAIISGVCFILPWVGCESGMPGIEKNISGADIGDELWIVFIAAVVILIISFYFSSLNQPEKAKPFIIISSLVAIGILLFKYIKFKNNELSGLLNFEIKVGSIGTLVGFALSLFGSTLIETDESSTKTKKIPLYELNDPEGTSGLKAYDTDEHNCMGEIISVNTETQTCIVSNDLGEETIENLDEILVEMNKETFENIQAYEADTECDHVGEVGKFCTKCGEKLECDHVDEIGKFCTKCGIKII